MIFVFMLGVATGAFGASCVIQGAIRYAARKQGLMR